MLKVSELVGNEYAVLYSQGAYEVFQIADIGRPNFHKSVKISLVNTVPIYRHFDQECPELFSDRLDAERQATLQNIEMCMNKMTKAAMRLKDYQGVLASLKENNT